MNTISYRTARRRAAVGAALACSAAWLVGAAPASAATGPVALWHMDETSGTVMRDSVGSHSGSLHSVQLGLAGYLGKAYGFTGSSYVSVPSASDLNPGKADWDLIRKGKADTSGGEWKVEYQPSGQASCGFKGTTSSSLTRGPALNDGKWHTVQCVKTSSTIKLIVDGQTYSKTVSVGAISNTAPVVIGAHPGSEFFKGALDEASIQID